MDPARGPLQFGETAPAWAPSEAARGWLLLGCISVLADAVLSAAGLGATLVHAHVGRIDVGQALEWAAVLPQLGVLAALLTLAREAEHRGLWKSSLGFIGVAILALVLSLAVDESLKRPLRTGAALVVAGGMLALIVVAVGNWPRFSKSPGSASPDTSKKVGKGCLSTALLPILLVAAKLFARGLPKLKLGGPEWMMIGFCALGVLGLFFAVWFAWSKIQLAGKFGKTALLVGVFELLVLAVGLAALGAFAAVAAPSLANGHHADVERLAVAWGRGAAVVGMAVYVLWGVLLAWLFLTVRKLAEPDWRFQFSADGAPPWS